MKEESIFNWKWKLSDNYKVNGIKKHGLKVFSCFACGGGSTMGYKLAGFDVIGCNEIDPKMMEVYNANHKPKYFFLESIVDFKNRKDLPGELYELDILDGSPPCSSFSIAGNREKDWGKKKKFKEGQAMQVLDTLFFDFINLAKELQPKVVVAENVKGLLMGNAKKYKNRILSEFEKAGYLVDYFLLNAKNMGVPQKRERVFFIAIRKDLAKPFERKKDLFTKGISLNLNLKYKEIKFKDIFVDCVDTKLSPLERSFWENRVEGDIDFSVISKRIRGVVSHFNSKFLYKDKVANTITSRDCCVLFDYPRRRNLLELISCGSFPTDYNFLNQRPSYIIGMSVPPVMIANIARIIYNEIFQKKSLN